MHVLFVTPAPPFPPTDGARLIAANLARVLAREHTLTLACLTQNEPVTADTARYFAHVQIVPKQPRTGTRKWLASLTDDLPFWVRECDSETMRMTLCELRAQVQFDVVHIDTGMMAQYVPELGRLPIVIAPHDSLSLALRQRNHSAPRWRERLLARLEYPKMKRYEATRYASGAQRIPVCVVTTSEKEYLLNLNSKLDVRVIPNGVDTDFFAPSAANPLPNTLGFGGVMEYPPNRAAALYFAREVMPRVWRDCPDAVFNVIGRDPSYEIRALANNSHIRVTGTVSDMRPHLAAQSVVVCPMQSAGGIKNKVLEALAMGKAVVATPEAIEGIDVRDGQELVVARDADGLAAVCLRLLNDETERRRLGETARAWACSQSWEACAAQYLEVYQEAIHASAVRGA